MFTPKEATEERVKTYTDALEKEKVGYEARIAGVEAGHPDPRTVEQLKDRVKQVDAEKARVGKLKPKGKKG